MTGFGLYPLVNEGAPIHPAALCIRAKVLSDDEYQKMLSAYRDYYGVEVAITPRKIIEVLGPKMAYFEFPYDNKEQLYRIPYRSFSFVSPSPVELAIKADAALKTIRDALAETKGDGPAVLFWRTDTHYEINSVLDAETKEPNGQFQLSCRLGTYPLLDEKIWQSF
jgi:hypothetical protein